MYAEDLARPGPGRSAAAPALTARILVVDDEPPIVDLVAGYLVREGWDVRTADSGPAALDLIRCWSPDAIVLDLMLPGFDGVEVCRQMRAFSDAYVLMLRGRPAHRRRPLRRARRDR